MGNPNRSNHITLFPPKPVEPNANDRNLNRSIKSAAGINKTEIKMKILAATKHQYTDTSYIVEITSSEILGLLMLHSYSDLDVIDKDGNKKSRKRDELISGDTVESSLIKQTAEAVRQLRSEKEQMGQAFTLLRGAMTKIQNIIQ